MTTPANAPDLDEVWGDAPKSFSWDVEPPHEFVGVFVKQEVGQQTDYDDPTIKLYWNDGRPRKKVILTYKCDPTEENPDGIVNIHANIPGGIHSALKSALKDAGQKRPETGEVHRITFTEEVDTGVDGSKLKKGQKRKIFTAVILDADTAAEYDEPPF